VQTSARLADLAEAGVAPGAWLSVEPGGAAHVMLLGPTFSAVPNGELVAYEDSAQHVAFAVNGGSAASRLGLRPGTPIVVRAIRSHIAPTPRG
jgi:S-adenosylmethionine hydrolase